MKTTGQYHHLLCSAPHWMSRESAVRESFLLGSVDTMQNVRTTLCHMTAESHDKSPELKWPPVPDDLEDPDMSDALTKLLSYISCGKETPSSSHTHRFVQSVAQDICRASANGTWKLPKHIKMVMSLCHLFRCKSLITL